MFVYFTSGGIAYFLGAFAHKIGNTAGIGYLRIMKTLLVALALFLATPAITLAADKDGPFSPFDALTSAEVDATVAVLEHASDADDQTFYPTITLQEGPKDELRNWVKGKPMQRTAFVVLRRGDKTYEAVVNITAKKIISYE